jgi:N-acetyl-1-D-myo-inositol-2-amino-2-deoxy-alpha-D-glucopyranoside deacetylase
MRSSSTVSRTDSDHRPPTSGAGARPTICLVHAHPDDESITTGGVIARAKRAGHRVVLVTCTLGEEGEIHNLDEAAARPRLAEIRARELRRACAILGVDRLELLGYRDSGMAGAPANNHPASFHAAPLEAAAARVAQLLRAERPAVVVTYTPDGTYGHPDHVKAHRVTVAALDLLHREDGWRPRKTYWQALPRGLAERAARDLERRGARLHGAFRGVGVPDREITTEVDVGDLLTDKRAAIAAHVTQNPPDLMASLTGQILAAMSGFEHFVLRDGAPAGGEVERDLFAGLSPAAGQLAGARPERRPLPGDARSGVSRA